MSAGGPERPSIADQLGRGEDDLRRVVEAAKEYAIFMLDPEGKVATWNAGAQRFKGYAAEEILGRHFSCFYPREDVEAGKPQRELEIAEREGRHEDEGWRVRKDGSRFWASAVITALRDPQGTLLGYGKVTRDLTDRVRASEQFRLAIEAAPTGMIMVDHRGRIVLVNAQVEKLFGYSRDELIGRPIEMLVPERFRLHHREFRATFATDPQTRPMGVGRDLFGLRKDGTELPIEIGLNPLGTPEGTFVLSSVADITERKRTESERNDLLGQLRTLNADLEERVRARTSELQSTLKEREVLLQEIHHRVKNNLQVISSLINMQVRRLPDGASRDALRECQSRVEAIALIHEKLYRSKDYSRIPFSEYVRTLADNVFAATGVSPAGVALAVDIEEVALRVDMAIPCGLILTELITNTLKHAFPRPRSGTLRIELSRRGPQLVLTVRDDGVGLPPGLDVRRAETLGLQLICTLADQLEAKLEVRRDGGTAFEISFAAEA